MNQLPKEIAALCRKDGCNYLLDRMRKIDGAERSYLKECRCALVRPRDKFTECPIGQIDVNDVNNV